MKIICHAFFSQKKLFLCINLKVLILLLYFLWLASFAYVNLTSWNLEHLIVSCPSAPILPPNTSLFNSPVCWIDCDIDLDCQFAVYLLFFVCSSTFDCTLLVLLLFIAFGKMSDRILAESSVPNIIMFCFRLWFS